MAEDSSRDHKLLLRIISDALVEDDDRAQQYDLNWLMVVVIMMAWVGFLES